MPVAPAAPRSLDATRALPVDELLARFALGVENFDRRVVDLTEPQLDTTFDPGLGVGAWSARVLLGHLADAALWNVVRMRKAAGEDNPVFQEWDENAYIESGLYARPGARPTPAGAFIALIHTLRRSTGAWLATLDADSWARAGLHPTRGRISVKDIAAIETWHLEHHAAFLKAKIDRLLGPACDEPMPKGRCGPNCGCHAP